jgi:hypothetical protein
MERWAVCQLPLKVYSNEIPVACTGTDVPGAPLYILRHFLSNILQSGSIQFLVYCIEYFVSPVYPLDIPHVFQIGALTNGKCFDLEIRPASISSVGCSLFSLDRQKTVL